MQYVYFVNTLLVWPLLVVTKVPTRVSAKTSGGKQSQRASANWVGNTYVDLTCSLGSILTFSKG